jgi:four helix bundle protein
MNNEQCTIKNDDMKKDEDNLILVKSKAFALRIIRLYKYLCEEKKEFVLSKQVLRSGTSIGANAKEASMAQSKKDFEAKLSIALKESGETEYWLELLHESGFIEDASFESIYADNKELIRIVTSILKSSRKK